MTYFIVSRDGLVEYCTFALESKARTTAATTAKRRGLRPQDVTYVKAKDDREAARKGAAHFRTH